MVTLTLDPVLDLAAAPSLKQALLDAGSGARIDAGAVGRITSPCLQLLVSAVRGGAQVTAASQELRKAAACLGLEDALGFVS